MLFTPSTRDHTMILLLPDSLSLCVLHIFIWLEQLYDTHLDEDDYISFCFYYTPQFHRKHATTRQKSESLWTILDANVFFLINPVSAQPVHTYCTTKEK
jgi:hypothetical protein